MNLSRRTILSGALAATFAPSLSLASGYRRWRRIRKALVVNALGGLWDPNSGPPSEEDLTAHRLGARAMDDALASGLDAVNLTIGHVFGEGDPFEMTIEEIAWWDEAARAAPDKLLKVLDAADIKSAQETGRLGLIYGFQNSEMFGDKPERAGLFRDLGVRIVQLTYNLRNRAGDGALVEENTGLTEFGRNLVEALNAERLLVDLSHGGEKLTMDAIAASKAPVAITHTGCAALAAHPRNRGDAELRALAEKGGVAGIYWMPYLTPGRQHRAADIVAHIEHAVNVMGEDHVGVGADGTTTRIDDMDGFVKAHREDIENRKRLGVGAPNESPDIITIPPDLMGPTQYEQLAAMLSAKGWKDARIEKILGLNFLRLFGEVW